MATIVSPRRPAGSGPGLDRGAELAQERGDPAADLVDAGAGIAAAVDVDEFGQVFEVGRQVGADRAAQGVQLGGRREGRCDGRGVHGGSLCRGHLAILPGPCVWSRPACSKVRMSTGSSRWSSSSSPSAGGGPGTGSAIPGATRWSTSAPTCPARDWPDPIAATVAWIRRLRTDHGEGRSGLAVHRSSDPGHWIITFPWTGAERAQTLSEAALALAERDVSPSRTAQLTGAQERLLARWTERIEAARTTPPEWLRDADRRIPIVSISGTNGKSTVTRLMTHILLLRRAAGRDDHLGRRPGRRADDRAGRLDRAGRRAPGPRPPRRRGRGPRDGPGRDRPARRRLRVERRERPDQRLVRPPRPAGHPYPPRAGRGEIDDLPDHQARRLGRAQRRRPAGRGGRPAREGQRRAVHARGRRLGDRARAIVGAAAGPTWNATGRSSRPTARPRRRSWRSRCVPITIGGLARHNVANALAAAGGARGLGATIEQVRDGLIRFRAERRELAGPAQPVPPRIQGGDRGLRPQRGRDRRRAGRGRRGSPAGRPAGPRRSPRSSAPPGTGPTTRCAGSAGSPPSEPSASPSSRRSSTCADGPRSRSSAS